MKPVYLTDKEIRHHLYPFSQIRSVADIRIGILTLREKWEALLKQDVKLLPVAENFAADDAIIFSSNIIPTRQFVESLGVFAYVNGAIGCIEHAMLQFCSLFYKNIARFYGCNGFGNNSRNTIAR